MSLVTFICAELARNGLRLAVENEPAWWEWSSAGMVRATDAELPFTPDLLMVALEWDEAAGCSPVTPQILADLWAQPGGAKQVAEILVKLPAHKRNRLCLDYWRLLRAQQHDVSLVQVGLQFHLLVSWAA